MAAKQQLLAVIRPTATGQQPQQHINARNQQRPGSLPHLQIRELEYRVREKLLKEHSPSTYDTAWVGMVPAQGSPLAPRFPQFVEWIRQNQHDDGSWGVGNLCLPLLGKDAISSTTACILALKTWNIGYEQIMKGLHFIKENHSRLMDEKCYTPVGFNLIFPQMVMIGIDMGLEFPLSGSDKDWILRLREAELKSVKASGGNAYHMAYVAEGLGDLQLLNQVLTYQRKDGSLFNSPSATAALAIDTNNAHALKYLDFLAEKCGSSVPAVYPTDMYSQLCMVDTLEKIGIAPRFTSEIKYILDMTYSSWQQKNEELIMDLETCAMAFRVLRQYGYDISSDALSHFAEDRRFYSSVEGDLNDTKTLLELYKASQVCIVKDERALDDIGSWTKRLLKQQLCSKRVQGSLTSEEVEYVLQYPLYSGTVEPLQQKRTIESYNTKLVQMGKSAYTARHSNEDILALAIEEFSSSQAFYQKELECIVRWWEKVGLHQLKFVRVMPLNVFIFLASTVLPSELQDASIAWIQNSILVTVIDDFFDGAGSTEELKNLVALIEKWDAHEDIGFCSENVETLFYAVYSTNNQIGAKAEEIQNRSVMGHIAEVWGNVVRAYMIEAEWTRERHVPTMEEYMSVAELSVALCAIVPPCLYLVGPKLSEDMIRCSEYEKLLRHLCVNVRLLNDLRTYKKEMTDGYINSVLLKALGDGLSPESIEAAKMEISEAVADSRRELLMLVLRDGVSVPRPCRDVFWNSYKIGQLFYGQGDGFSMPQELVAAVNAVVHEPLLVMADSCLD